MAMDMDGDADVDVLSAWQDEDIVAWYENDGSQDFEEHIITNDADFVYQALPVDINGDGFIDIISPDQRPVAVTIFERFWGGKTTENRHRHAW